MGCFHLSRGSIRLGGCQYVLLAALLAVGFAKLISSESDLKNPADSKQTKSHESRNTPVPDLSRQATNELQLPAHCDIKLNKVTGRIFSLQHDDPLTLRQTLMNTRILINHGQYIAFPREDGTFELDGLPPDSYVVEVTHPRYIYEPVRVDITSKGKIRARRVNYIQPAIVQTVDYPLKFQPRSLHNYFLPRETWRIMDLLLNPMVLMMIVPLVVIWLLPKLMSPQEAQAQRDNPVQLPEYNVPELSEMMASMFGGQSSSQQQQGGSQGGAGPRGGSGSSGDQQPAAIGSGQRHSKSKRK